MSDAARAERFPVRKTIDDGFRTGDIRAAGACTRLVNTVEMAAANTERLYPPDPLRLRCGVSRSLL